MSDAELNTLDITRIMDMIPHRYPILLVDRIVELEEGERAVGLKNVTFNEPHFQGHFPGAPVMPGVLIVEAMAQTAAILVVKTLGEAAEGKLVYFMTIDNARFRKPVTPGDSVYIEVKKVRSRGMVWKFVGVARVNDKVVAEATFSAMIRD
jgi:3-hydroxyacyl-[acyl-carrier-protein] dehydratase|tara:strand:- start:61548 stop:62000 length:453 start_codon:yes stop_codon:yes gene_type:complete